MKFGTPHFFRINCGKTLPAEYNKNYNDRILRMLSIIIGQGWINELQYCWEKEKVREKKALKGEKE